MNYELRRSHAIYKYPAARPRAESLLICLLLAACGGGGGGGNGDTAASPQGGGTSTAPGKGYFVDAGAGNDGNLGSFEAPWKSLARLNAVTLIAGESIYLRCGSVWREPLALGRTQLIDGSAVSAYGTNCSGSNKPRISAADDFSGAWTKTGNVWSRRVALGTSKIQALSVNGTLLRVAQWPNFKGVGHEYALAGSGAGGPSKNTLPLTPADRAALADKDLSRATVQLRTEPWVIEARVVDKLDAAGLKLTSSTTYPIDTGDGYVLQDKLWMLDAPGEFFHDAALGMLYVYPSTAAAQLDFNAAVVEATVRDVAVVVGGRSNLKLKDLSVDMARTDGLTLNEAPGAVVDGVDASNNLWAGVRVNLHLTPAAPARGVTIRNGVYAFNGLAGIDAAGAPNADVVSNTVKGTGMMHAGWPEAGIVLGDGGLVQGNVIEQSAFRGIVFSGLGGTRVVANALSGYCLRLADCAAIYTFSGGDQTSAAQAATVEGNRVSGATPNLEGNAGGQLVAGIYLDDKSRGISVRNNVLTGMPIGIFLHNASNNLVEGNKVWLTTDTSLLFSMDNSATDLGKGNVFRANQLAPSSWMTGAFPALPQLTSSLAIRFIHAIDGRASLSKGANTFSGNQVVAFNGDTNAIADAGYSASTGWLSARQWAALNPGEGAPSAPATFATHRSTLGAELLGGGGFDDGLGSWTSYFAPVAVPGAATAVAGATGCTGPCVRMLAGSLNDRLSSPLFRMTPGAQYVISFAASFEGIGDIAHPDIARPDTPYESFIDPQGLKVTSTTLSGRGGDVIRYEAFFTASSNDQARVNLRVATLGVPVNYDSVSLRQVTGYEVSKFSDWGAVVAAPLDTAKTVACADLAWPSNCVVLDIDGNAVAMPLSLAAGTNRLLLLANSSWRR